MPELTRDQITDMQTILSAPRFATYLRESSGDHEKAMALYCWNIKISSALFFMIHFSDLALRNGIVEVLEKEFGQNWYLNRGFCYTLPNNVGKYKPKDDLKQKAARLPTAGKVVAELKNIFWESLLVRAQDPRLWRENLVTSFPGSSDDTTTYQEARYQLHNDAEQVRKLRNRIAHHEPLLSRNISTDIISIMRIIRWRRPSIADWLSQKERASDLLRRKPILLG